MLIKLRLGEPLWRKVEQREIVIHWDVPGGTLADFLVEVSKRYPPLVTDLTPSFSAKTHGDAQPQPARELFYSIFLNSQQIRPSETNNTFLANGDEVLLILPLAGG